MDGLNITQSNGDHAIRWRPLSTFVINGADGPMVTVDLRTGHVTFGENYDLDEAARVFWRGMGLRAPKS